MAYYLQFDGTNDYVLLPFARPDSLEINIRFSAPAQLDRRFISWAQDTSTAFMGIGSGNTSGTQTKLRKFGGGGSNLTGTADVFDGNIHDIKILITDNFLEIFVDGSPTPDISTTIFSNETSSYAIWTLGAVVRNSNFSVSSACNMNLYSITFSDDTVGATDFRDYNKQTLSGSNDTTLPDTVGGNDGALVNFPTDNSQWVFFDDGGSSSVTADVTFIVNAPTASASASATLPQPSADVSYSVSVPTVSASVAASLPQPLSDVAFTVNTPSVNANTSATIPGYNASVSFTVNSPTVSADASATLPSPGAGISYTVSTPSVSADLTASLPQPDSGIAFTVNTPSVNATASATQTGWNAAVNFTVNAPSVSISASATLPQPEAAVSFTVSPPQVAVVAIVGGIAIIVDDETNINQRVLSNNINAPILSNNING